MPHLNVIQFTTNRALVSVNETRMYLPRKETIPKSWGRNIVVQFQYTRLTFIMPIKIQYFTNYLTGLKYIARQLLVLKQDGTWASAQHNSH